MKAVLRPLSIAVAAALGLSACFHDGVSEETSQVQLSGVVSKGVVIGGVVKAYPITNGVIDKTVLLGKDTTDAKGDYAITVLGYEGPIAIVMSPNGSSSQVKCDVPTGCTVGGGAYTFGQLMPLDYEMEAIVPNAVDGAVSASVTPLTHMAAAYAKTIGLDKDTAAAANEKVAKLLGITDILGSKPVDVTDDGALGSSTTSLDAIKYGYMAAAIAKIAQDDVSGDVGTALQSLADSFASKGGELLNNESVDNASVVSLAEITTAAQAIMAAETNVTGGVFSVASSDIDDLKTAADTAVADSKTVTTVTTTITSSDINTAKLVVAELRTWAQTVNNELLKQVEDPSLLDPASPATFAKKVDTALTNDNGNIDALMQGIGYAVMAGADAYAQIQNGGLADGTHALSDFIMDANVVATGNAVISGQSLKITGATFAITDPMDNSVRTTTVTLDVTMPTKAGAIFTGTINSASASNSGASMSVDAASTFAVTMDKTLTNLFDDTNATTAAARVSKVSMTLGGKLQQTASATLVDPVSFTGKASGVLHFSYTERQDGYYDYSTGQVVSTGTWTQEDVAPEWIKLDGTFSTKTGDTLTAVAEGYMRNAATFKPVAPLPLGTVKANAASYTVSADRNEITLVMGDRTMTYSLAITDATSGFITRTEYYGDGGYWTNSYPVALNGEADLLAYANGPTHVIYGSYAWFNGEGEYYVDIASDYQFSSTGGTIPGVLVYGNDDGENATMWRDIDGKLTFTATFVGMPTATFTLSADRTAWHAGKGTATVQYRNVKITANGSVAEVEGQNDPAVNLALIVDVTDKGRLELYPDLQSNSALGTIKVNGNIVGSIKPSETLDGTPQLVVTYKDGTFDTVLF